MITQIKDKITQIFKKDFVVGLDIGTSSIKIAQFAEKEDGLYLVRCDLKEIKHIDNEAMREKEIIEILKDLLRGIDIGNSKIIVGINCPHTAIKRVILPYMPRQELRDGISLEAKNYFPFPIEDALIDFEIVGEVMEKGIRKYQVLIATSPNKTVNEYLSLLEKIGIKPASFIPAPYALQKLNEVFLSKEDKIQCLVDIGSHHTELAIFSAEGARLPDGQGSASGGKGKNLIFSRKIPVAGSDFTKAMTDVLVSDRGRTELSFDEAEKIKQKMGIPSEDESRVIDEKISTTQILSLLRAPLEQLVNEIDRCLDYYREEISGGKVDSLVLLGQGAFLKGLAEFFSKELGMEVNLGMPFEALKFKSGAMSLKAEDSPRLALAIGAGLSEGKGINLLPAEIKEERKRTFKRTTFETVTIGAILILAFIYIGMQIQLNNFQKRISVARMEYSSLRPQLSQVEAQSLLADEPYWDDVFKELSIIIPPDIYLTEFSLENKTIKMRGIVVSGEREESLYNFILALEQGIFKNVKLVTTKEKKEISANEFELICGID
jgi:type IV pilus assembly protein PilM